jgi:hypothetical protein
MAPGLPRNLLQREVPAGQARASSVLAEQILSSGVKRVLRGYLRLPLDSGLMLIDRDAMQESGRVLVPVGIDADAAASPSRVHALIRVIGY